MNDRQRDYIRVRVEDAQESLRDARVLLDTGGLRAAVNRLYYACFYAVEALLWTEGLAASRHKGVRSLFQRHWVHAGRLPRDMGRFYHNLFESRMQVDYRHASFEKHQVAAWLQTASEFVGELLKEVQKRTQDHGGAP